MAGDHTARILNPKAPLQGTLEQISRLRNETQADRESRDVCWRESRGKTIRDDQAGHRRAYQAADSAGPRLAGRNGGYQLRPAEQAADHVGADVAGPDDRQYEQRVGQTDGR